MIAIPSGASGTGTSRRSIRNFRAATRMWLEQAKTVATGYDGAALFVVRRGAVDL